MRRSVRSGSLCIEYELIQTQRRTLEIRLLHDGQVRLFAPRRAVLRECDAFVGEHAEWIQNAGLKLREYGETRAARQVIEDGARILYEGELVPLCVRPAPKNRVWFDGERIHVETRIPELARRYLKDWMIERMRERTHALLSLYVPLVGRAPGRVAIRDQKTRWGSCSGQGNVNFNYKLIMAPPEALRYVVIHELCHLYDFNHSERFWARVNTHQPDHSLWKKWLKINGHLLGV